MLNHPHIAQIYGLDEASGTHFLQNVGFGPWRRGEVEPLLIIASGDLDPKLTNSINRVATGDLRRGRQSMARQRAL